MDSASFNRIARARAALILDRLAAAPADGERKALSAAAWEAACACLFAGLYGAAADAARIAGDARDGRLGLLGLSSRIRLLKGALAAADAAPAADVSPLTPPLFAPVVASPRRPALPNAVVKEAALRRRGLYASVFTPELILGDPEGLAKAAAALAVDGSLLALVALTDRRGSPRGFAAYACARPSSRGENLVCGLGALPAAGTVRTLMAPGRASLGDARGFKTVERVGLGAKGASRPKGRGAVAGAGPSGRRRVLFPIGAKLGLAVSSLLILSLASMGFLSSFFFLRDATVRIEENNYNLAQISAGKLDDDLRSLADRARLLLDLSGGDPESDVARRFFALNPDILYVGVPGLAELPNAGALAARGVDPGAASAAAAGRAAAAGVAVFNAAPALGAAAVGVIQPYREGAFEGSLVAMAGAERYASMLGARGVVETFVVASGGELILHADESLLAAGASLAGNRAVQAMALSAAGNGQLRYHDERGVEYLASFRRGYGDAGVIAQAPVDKAFEAVRAIERRNLYLFGAVLSLAAAFTYFFSRSISGPVEALMGAALQIEDGLFELDIEATTRDELGALTETFVEMGRGLAEREKIKDAFGRFVNKSVAEMAMKGEIKLGGERREATVFFSDIRSFTAISESMRPEQVVEFLNQYLSRMVRCVNASGGVVDKFIGDAIMAVWGVPVSTGRDPLAAVEASLAMRSSLAEFNRGRGGPGKPVIRIGAGLNTGPVLAGQIGSNERMEYTVIGDAVNLASRIEALNKPFGTDILVSEYTLGRLGGAYEVVPMPLIRVKGKAEPLRVYAVLRRKGDPSGPRDLRDLRELYGMEGKDFEADHVMDESEEKKYEILGAKAGAET